MITGIDHLVIISPNLEDAVARATVEGFTVVPGGTHTDGATHNALVAFSDGSYIELIAPTSGIEGGSHRWFPRLGKGGGLVDICLASDDLVADVAVLREHGRTYTGPDENGRHRPDGAELRWKGAMPPGAVGETGWPFLIEDVTPRELRVSNDPDQTTHANGALGVAGVTILTRTLADTVADYEAITGRTAQILTSPLDETPLAAIISFGASWLLITHPTAGAAVQHLEQFGPGPYALTLRTHDGPISPGTGHAIPPELLTGAMVELV